MIAGGAAIVAGMMPCFAKRQAWRNAARAMAVSLVVISATLAPIRGRAKDGTADWLLSISCAARPFGRVCGKWPS